MKELTKSEDQIMQILWKLEKAFVNDIIDNLPAPKPAYNTVSTIVRILETKGFIGHKAFGKTHEYFPLITQEKYSRFYLNNMIKGHFDGSFNNLVSFFTGQEPLKVHEIDELLKHLQSLKKKKS